MKLRRVVGHKRGHRAARRLSFGHRFRLRLRLRLFWFEAWRGWLEALGHGFLFNFYWLLVGHSRKGARASSIRGLGHGIEQATADGIGSII